MAFDFVRPSGLWVGTATGDLLLFDTRAKLQTASTCKRALITRSRGCKGVRARASPLLATDPAYAVMHRVASADGSPVSVAAIRGYVASLSGAGMVEVHNTTGEERQAMLLSCPLVLTPQSPARCRRR